MPSARDQMKIIEEELARVRKEMERLKIEEATLLRMQARMNGTPEEKAPRLRSPSVKPVVLDIMRNAGAIGATSTEVDELVRVKVPSVAKDTVGSILSRLKSDGALVYVGDRYYERQFAPKPETAAGGERSFRTVN